MSQISITPVNEVLVMNIDDLATDWQTYVVNFTAQRAGPMVNGIFYCAYMHI